MALSRISTLALIAGAALCMAGAPTAIAATANSDPTIMGRIQSDLPSGIRLGLALLTTSSGSTGGGADRGRRSPAVLLADSQGRALYYATADCADECAKRWAPALVENGSKPTEHLTIVTNAAGQQQWAFMGKPLFTAAQGGVNFSQPQKLPEWDLLRAGHDPGLPVDDRGQDGMKLAVVNPKNWMKMPYSIGVAEYRLAPGQVLAAGVTGATPMGRPLYTYSGKPEQEANLPAMFKPQYASALSLPVGDFSVRTRPDGSQQWQYKGAPLYTCDCDISIGDLNGEGQFAGIAPATVFKYFLPKEVALKKDPLSVGRLVDAKTGKTLYFRDRLFDFFQPDASRPMLGTQVERIGAALNTAHCDAKCEREYRPLLAPKDAKAEGYWSIYERPDGKRQWAYKNYAMYTYEKEGAGRLDGNERHLVQFEDGTGAQALPPEFGLGLVWRASVP